MALPFGPPGALKRPHHEIGNYFYSQDLLTEQDHRLQRLRRHNRFQHRWGVVCGLGVVPEKKPRRPWALLVCPGYAIDCCGIEIEVCRASLVDAREYMWRAPNLVSSRGPHLAYVGLRFAEDLGKPVPSPQPGCGCEDTIYEESRIRDNFQIDILWEPPEPDDFEVPDLCQPSMVPCPPTCKSPYIILASITLPKSEHDPITQADIDLSIRRQVFPTNLLPSQLISCCCAKNSSP